MAEKEYIPCGHLNVEQASMIYRLYKGGCFGATIKDVVTDEAYKDCPFYVPEKDFPGIGEIIEMFSDVEAWKNCIN